MKARAPTRGAATRVRMSDLRKKLDALRAMQGLQTGAELEKQQAAAPPKPFPTEPLREKSIPSIESIPSMETSPQPTRLRDLLQRMNVAGDSPAYREREDEEEYRASCAFDIPLVLPGEVIGDERSSFYLVRTEYPLEHRQGNTPLGMALETLSHHIAFSACDPALQDFDPRKTLFVDTETIGLSGGTGTVAFLVGMGYFTEDGFRLDQCFLRDYDDEEAMLQYLAELIAKHEALVSYNGKSFDLPLLRTRFIQNRIPFRGDGVLHLDLVHVARRFWKRRLSDCSLGNIEREILEIRRHGDVPSYLIPSMWFAYLRTRDARPLEAVFYHHRMDILSLAALTGWLSKCLEQPNGEGFEHQEDRLSVVRVYFQQRKYEDVCRHAQFFLEHETQTALRRECLEMLGFACKRLQQWERMEQAWERLVEEFPESLTAYLELAKHLEHRRKDLGRAADLCKKAIDHFSGLRRSTVRAVYLEQDTEPLQKRLERIERKLARGGAGGEDYL